MTEEALRIGFIQRLVPADDLEKHTYDYLRGGGRQCAALHPRHQGPDPGHLRRHHRGASREAPGAGHRDVRERTTTRKARARSSRSGRPGSWAANAGLGPDALRIAVLSSTPLNPREGSGTFVGIAGLEPRPRGPRSPGGRAAAGAPHRLPHARPMALQRRRSPGAPARRRPRGGGGSRRLSLGPAPAGAVRGEPQGHHRR